MPKSKTVDTPKILSPLPFRQVNQGSITTTPIVPGRPINVIMPTRSAVNLTPVEKVPLNPGRGVSLIFENK